MAKQQMITISGMIGNMIFYTRNGKACVRSRPAKVKQTKGTKASAGAFGKAVYLGTALRNGLKPILPQLPGANGKSIMYRLNTALLQWLLHSKPNKNTATINLPFIDGFEFNPESELTARLKKKPVIDWTKTGKIILTIPALDSRKDISAPASTEMVHWKIMAVRAGIGDHPDLTGIHNTEIETPYTKGVIAEQKIELPVAPKMGEIIIVVITLRYVTRKKGSLQLIDETRWLPAAVVGCCCGRVI